MSDLLVRTAELILRADDPTGRRIFGRLVPFNTVATVSDGGPSYQESFAPGSFQRTIAERADKVKLLVSHDQRRLPIGRAVELVERADGLHGEFLVSATREGDDVLALVRDGAVDSFSVGFRGIADVKRDGVTVRTEVALREVSLVSFPAYDGALIGGVRASSVPSTELTRSRLLLALSRFQP